MQPAQRSPRSRVGWWLIIGGSAALLLAMILLFTRTDTDTLGGTSPPNRNLAVLEGENSTVIHLSGGMTISSFVEESSQDPDVSIISPSGKNLATVQETVPSLFNKSTFVQYRLTSSWYVAEEGDYTLISNTSADQIWFVDLAPIIEEQGNTRDSTMFSTCCLSLCLIPIGIIVLLVTGGQSRGVGSGTTQMMMQTDDGRLIPVVMQEQPHQQVQMGVALPTTNDVYAAYHGHAKSDPIASDPDAHSAIRTTNIPDPFIGENTVPNEEETVPDVQIVATATPNIVQNVTTHITTNIPASDEDKSGSESDDENKGAWKVWDDG
ncbi:MAG TPA: hypothetical protein QF646_01460 [Candidatus Poseidoniales archaeon]|nr:hypothetical protein [Candidatus Poseidoniales archaeon]